MKRKVPEVTLYGEVSLTRVLAAQKVLRKHAPRLTAVGVQLLMFVAEKTSRNEDLDTPPTTKEIRETLGLKMTGAARLLEVLSLGRRDRGVDGYGLIQTDEFLGRARTGVWVLTDKGAQCVREYLAALTGNARIKFNPKDLGSVVKILVSRGDQRIGSSK